MFSAKDELKFYTQFRYMTVCEMVKRVTRLRSLYKLFNYAEVLPIMADMNY
jgi:hypothetical protein